MRQITRLKPADKRATRILVELDGMPWVELDTEVALKEGLRIGQPLEDVECDRLVLADEAVRARRAGARLLHARPRAVAELGLLLRRKGFSDTAADTAIAHFCAIGDLDDERFARIYARHEFKLHTVGPMRVRHKLRELGVEAEIVDRVLESEPLATRDTQEASARRFIERRLPRLRGDVAGRKRRILGALQRAGFDSAIVWPLVREMVTGDDAGEGND